MYKIFILFICRFIFSLLMWGFLWYEIKQKYLTVGLPKLYLKSDNRAWYYYYYILYIVGSHTYRYYLQFFTETRTRSKLIKSIIFSTQSFVGKTPNIEDCYLWWKRSYIFWVQYVCQISSRLSNTFKIISRTDIVIKSIECTVTMMSAC